MICVVGGSGFVGSRLCLKLSHDGIGFCIVDNRASAMFPDKVHLADVRDQEALRRAIPLGCEVLVNLAAEHRDDVRPRTLYDEVNVNGARNLCAIAEEKGIQRILFTSSVACYGFAPANTGEDGRIRPFNDYGRTKAEAETIFREWQQLAPNERSLVIIRPTVIFGERNRGNVYNLLRQISKGRFVMVGSGRNVKSMAYVENVVAFLNHCFSSSAGVHIYNYIDKPDVDMRALVSVVKKELGKEDSLNLRLPYPLGYGIGASLDLLARVTGKKFPISAIRVKKFCSTTQFASRVATTGFTPPVSVQEGLRRTVRFEFLEDHSDEPSFYTE